MANDKQSLTNYDTILWLWDATDEERIKFLASLNPDQRSQLGDVLRDVLNNPWDGGRSAIKLTKLNKLLGQNVDRIKKQVQFSGDRTPDLDEKQIFRLFHDYTVLNHNGTRRLTVLGRDNLKHLLMIVDNEFKTYYYRDGSHPQLMWNGFQNDTLFPNEGMEKTQVEPTDYGELNDKITNYYFPVGGGPRPQPKVEDDYDYQGDYQGGEDDKILPDSLQTMHLRYLPVFLSYILFAVHAGFFGIYSPWSILFGLITLFGSVKWYHIFKFYDRGWASLFQGYWVLNYFLSLALTAGGLIFFMFTLTWPLVAFWFLAKKLHCHTSGQKKFIVIWAAVLGVVGMISVFQFSSRQNAAYENMQNVIKRQEARKQSEERRAEERQVAEAKAAQDHIASIRSREGGISWKGLISSDLRYLTSKEMEILRLQVNNILIERNDTVSVLALSNLQPAKRDGYFKVNISLTEPIYVAFPEESGLVNLLGLVRGLGVGQCFCISLDTPAKTNFVCELGGVGWNNVSIHKSTMYDGKEGARILFGGQLRKHLLEKRHAYIQIGSQAENDLKVLAKIVRQVKNQIKADELVARVDTSARNRLNVNNQKISYLRELVSRLYSAEEIITTLSPELKRIVDSDDWSDMNVTDDVNKHNQCVPSVYQRERRSRDGFNKRHVHRRDR